MQPNTNDEYIDPMSPWAKPIAEIMVHRIDPLKALAARDLTS